MTNFLKSHNFEREPNTLKVPLNLLNRLPKGNKLAKSLEILDSGIGAGVDFEAFNKATRGTPDQIYSELNRHIGELRGQKGRDRFSKERAEFVHKVNDRSVQLDDHLKDIKGADLVALNGKGGGCYGNVYISNKDYGTSYTGEDYVNSVLKDKARILTYEPKDQPDFKALVYADRKTEHVFETRGPDNQSLNHHR